MRIWAIIPVKNLRHGKSRLASVLDHEQRKNLVESLLINTISELQKSKIIDEILVITADRRAAVISKKFNTSLIRELGWFGLNWAINKGIRMLINKNVNLALILPIDLPLLSQKDIRKFVGIHKFTSDLTISPDHKLMGTNMMLFNPRKKIRLRFGKESLRYHLEAAYKNNSTITVSAIKNILFDLDEPDDYQFLKENE